MSTSTTRKLPAEWAKHAATVVAWPGRSGVWGRHLSKGRQETAILVAAIAESEPVVLIESATQPAELTEDATPYIVNRLCIPLDDCWARDISPLFVKDPEKGPIGIGLNFNSWGEKFRPYGRDAAFAEALCRRCGIPFERTSITMEGGSISTDGAGTALVVEPTLLNPNRNPESSRSAVETELFHTFGITNVVWLPAGLLGDTDTDGHVDNVASFCGKSRILVQVCTERREADYERLAENLRILSRARDTAGKQFDIVEVPWLPRSSLDPLRPASFLNSYPTNEHVLVPTIGSPWDDDALALVSEAFGGRTPRAIPSDAMAFAGGGPHCMTMQIPTSHANVLEATGETGTPV